MLVSRGWLSFQTAHPKRQAFSIVKRGESARQLAYNAAFVCGATAGKTGIADDCLDELLKAVC